MRIGVNAGSLERELVEKYGYPCPPAMVESAIRYIEIAESENYHQMIVSLKSSDVLTAVEAYRLYAKLCDYPTHIGITEAGKPPYAVTKSASRPGADPARRHRRHHPHLAVWATRSPKSHAAFDILQATQRRVPPSGTDRLPDLRATRHRPRRTSSPNWKNGSKAASRSAIKISVLGCVVNGPGEAREADIGIAAGNGKGVIFRDGEIVRHVVEAEMVDALMEEVERWEKNHVERERKPGERHRLPVIAG